MLRVSDAGPWRRCGLHRGRRPKAFNERNRDGRRLVVRLDLYEPGTVKPDFSASFALSSILLFDRAHSFVPTLASAERGARSHPH
jgi:hypothetical protein